MNSDHLKNIDVLIDALCDSLVWGWRYYFALEGLHIAAKEATGELLGIGSFLNCIWASLYEALFAKASHLIDGTKNVNSFYLLFKLVRRYAPENGDLLRQVSVHETMLKNEVAAKISNWRNQRLSHLTSDGIDDQFHRNNQLHLKELRSLLESFEDIINAYCFLLFSRIVDTKSGAINQKDEAQFLLSAYRHPQYPHEALRSNGPSAE